MIVGDYRRVLDHGFITLVDRMGTDTSIVEAARVSVDGGFKSATDNRRLIRYLISHDHMSPFEMVEFKFRVCAPMFVARQWFRHRTGSFNEISRRYTEFRDDFYEPEDWYSQGKTNKQGSGIPVSAELQPCARKLVEGFHDHVRAVYKELIDLGVSREQARIVLPMSSYTWFMWKVNLRNLLHFLDLRQDDAAQMEIRVYADVLEGVVRHYCPYTHEAWSERRKR